MVLKFMAVTRTIKLQTILLMKGFTARKKTSWGIAAGLVKIP